MAWQQRVLAAVNRIGAHLPRPVLRVLADFPGVLPLFEHLSAGTTRTVRTPEGLQLVINPLFHSNYVASGDVAGYEPEMRRALAALAQPGMTAYDIGANVGVFSLQLAALVGAGGRVYAFEPEPNNLACLEQTARLNSLPQLTVDRRAVGDATGVAHFDRRGGAFSGRLVGTTRGYHETGNRLTVETVRLDDAIAAGQLAPPDLLKVDVEGNEGMVLRGLVRTLRSRGPVVVCELHGHLGDSVAGVIAELRDAGYAMAHLADVAAGRWEPIAPDRPPSGHIVARRAGAIPPP